MLIGLGNYARVGKDAVASVLVQEHGFTRVAFADALKELALKADPLIYSNAMVNVATGRGHLKQVVHANGWENAKNQFPEVRKFLQNLGVAAREVMGENVWVDAAFAGFNQHGPEGRFLGESDVVVTDVRFPNEFERIKDLGGKLVKVSRPGYGPANQHVSETALEDFEWDYELQNNGTLDDLPAKVASMLEALK
jgi:hypothetical protein